MVFVNDPPPAFTSILCTCSYYTMAVKCDQSDRAIGGDKSLINPIDKILTHADMHICFYVFMFFSQTELTSFIGLVYIYKLYTFACHSCFTLHVHLHTV